MIGSSVFCFDGSHLLNVVGVFFPCVSVHGVSCPINQPGVYLGTRQLK